MTSKETTIRRLLAVITLDQTYIEFALPVITFVFLDSSSRLFPADTPYAVRSMWFGTCLSLPFFINLFFAPLLSTLSDEFGRRKFLLFEISSASLYMLLAGLGVLLGHLWLFMAGIVIRGAFSRTNTTALAIIGDASHKQKKMVYMGYLQVAISAGACMGPIIGGFFAHRFYFATLNYSLPFFIAAGLALLNSLITYVMIDETLQQRSSSAYADNTDSRLTANLRALKYVITHPDILHTSLILLLFQLSWSTYYQFAGPLLKTVYHFDAHQLGIFIGMIAFWLIIGAGPVFKWLHPRFNSHAILNLGAWLILAGIGTLLAVYFKILPNTFLWVSAIPTAMGDVLAYICIITLYSNLVPDHMQGKVMGINFLIVGLVWGCSGFLGGILISHSPILPLLLAPLGAFGSLLAINAGHGKNMVLSHAA